MMLTLFTASSTVAACGLLRRRVVGKRRDKTAARGHVRLTHFENTGAAFGLPFSRDHILIGSGLALVTALLHRNYHPVSTGLILGGGASNLAERLARGSVCDYVQFPKAPSPAKRYVFNLADFAVFAGLLGLLLPPRKRR